MTSLRIWHGGDYDRLPAFDSHLGNGNHCNCRRHCCARAWLSRQATRSGELNHVWLKAKTLQLDLSGSSGPGHARSRNMAAIDRDQALVEPNRTHKKIVRYDGVRSHPLLRERSYFSCPTSVIGWRKKYGALPSIVTSWSGVPAAATRVSRHTSMSFRIDVVSKSVYSDLQPVRRSPFACRCLGLRLISLFSGRRAGAEAGVDRPPWSDRRDEGTGAARPRRVLLRCAPCLQAPEVRSSPYV